MEHRYASGHVILQRVGSKTWAVTVRNEDGAEVIRDRYSDEAEARQVVAEYTAGVREAGE